MWKKQALFEHTTRTPLIISVPGLTNDEGKSSRVVEMLDIYPTLANLCNLKNIPQDLQGKNLLPLLQNPDAAWDGAAYSVLLRTPNRFIKYMKKESVLWVELFVLSATDIQNGTMVKRW